MSEKAKDPEGQELSFMERLMNIQQRVKVQKSEFNKFGDYNYRTAEGILSALKPLLKKHNLLINLSDEVLEISGHRYVKAVATLYDVRAQKFSSTGYAREADSRPKFDPSQLTGSASSYARKYALQGLLALDSLDADTTTDGNKLTRDAVAKLIAECTDTAGLNNLEKEIILFNLQEQANTRWKQLTK